MSDQDQPQMPRPDTIEPQFPQESPVPQESPAHQTPTEQPMQQPDEVNPTQPDQIQPDSAPSEVPEIPGN